MSDLNIEILFDSIIKFLLLDRNCGAVYISLVKVKKVLHTIMINILQGGRVYQVKINSTKLNFFFSY